LPSLHVSRHEAARVSNDITYTQYESEIVRRLTLPLCLLCLIQMVATPFFIGRSGLSLGFTHGLAALLLAGLHFGFKHKRFGVKWLHHCSVLVALLPFLAGIPVAGTQHSMMFTFYAIFCVLGSGCIFFSMHWFTIQLAFVLPLWVGLTLPSLPPELWPYHGAPLLAAIAIGGTFILARRNTCTHLEAIHVRQEVQRAADVFNQDLFTAMEQSETAVLIFSQRGRIEYANSGFSKLTGYEASETLGRTPEQLLDDEELWPAIISKLPFERGWQGDLLCRHKQGRPFWAHVSITPICEDGMVLRYSCVSEDVTLVKTTHHEMERLAFHDNLTGLKNRRLLQDRLDQALQENERNGESLALLYLDLDCFKEINDNYGHDGGDMLLQEVGKRLMLLVRAEDSVGRMGGDEFVVLLKRVESPEAAAHVAEKILRLITTPVNLGTESVAISTSIGIAISPADGNDSRSLLKSADAAMYQAKAQGRNRYYFSTARHNKTNSTRHDLEAALRQALTREEFVLLFQPCIDMNTHRISGSEALLRWNHPERGLLTPDVFMPAVEKMDMVVPLSHWVVRRVGEYLADLRTRGLDNMVTSINLSPRQLLDASLPRVVAEVLKSCHIKPSCLEFEVSESALSECGPEATNTLGRLKWLGVRLTLDNYGTGKLSPAQVAAFNLDLIKVDRSFIQKLPASSSCVDVTSAVIAMAHQLHLQVSAGGVETSDQLAFLDSQHCDFAQGYLFYHPLPMEELAALYRSDQVGIAN